MTALVTETLWRCLRSGQLLAAIFTEQALRTVGLIAMWTVDLGCLPGLGHLRGRNRHQQIAAAANETHSSSTQQMGEKFRIFRPCCENHTVMKPL